MPRPIPNFTGLDVIRLFENNLALADKRLVIAWFFSLIPVKEPKVDVVSLLFDLLSLVPIAGTIGRVFEISLATAQAAVEIAELFQFEVEEEEIELARLRLELQDLTVQFRELREERGRLLRIVDEQNERIQALLATQQLLEEENQELEQQRPVNIGDIADSLNIIEGRVDLIRRTMRRRFPPSLFRSDVTAAAGEISRQVSAIRGAL